MIGRIYKITNDINDKVYVGKTFNTIEKRFQQHCQDSKKERCEKRPLYNAMNLYGPEHFKISLIEECDESIINEREAYWIDYYEGYTKGYNATRGGDGKSYIDSKEILLLWEQGSTIKSIALHLGHDEGWIATILRNNGVSDEDIFERKRSSMSKPVAMLDKKNEEIIRVFPSRCEAVRYFMKDKKIPNSLLSGYAGHIGDVCLGKRKTCFGYKWKYIENE